MRIPVLVFAALIGGSLPAGAGLITFTKIADNTTVAPGGAGTTFRSFGNVDINNGEVLFFGQDSATSGWFSSQNGAIRRVIDSTTGIPGSGNSFSFSSGDTASISNGRIAFSQRGAVGGVFVAEPNGSITTVARVGDAVPGQAGIFAGLSAPLIDDNRIAMTGTFSAFGAGVYDSTGSGLNRVFDTNQNLNLPGINESLRSFTLNDIEDGTTLFLGGRFNSQDGIYTIDNGVVTKIVDINTAIPEGTGNFTSFDSRFARMDNGDVVFFARGDNGQQGIYVSRNGVLSKVADTSDGFTDLRAPVISGERIFFQGNGPGFGGATIFEFSNGSISRVIGGGDILDGRSVSIVQNSLAVDDNALVFKTIVGISSTAIYTANFASVPEPTGFALMLLGGGLMAARRKRRGLWGRSY